MLVAIHQPNFFPWLGYFDKIARSDVFVFLDHVQYQKTGGIWSNRVKLLVGGDARWVTAPIERAFHGVRRVCEVKFQSGNPWRAKLLKSLSASYARAPAYKETLDFFAPLILNPENNLARYNCAAVMAIVDRLGMPSGNFRWSSVLDAQGQANELLISITRAVGGSKYLYGGGAAGYQEEIPFSSAGVELVSQHFEHPVYPQRAGRDFVAGLSIIDAFMHCGLSGVRSILQCGTKVANETP